MNKSNSKRKHQTSVTFHSRAVAEAFSNEIIRSLKVTAELREDLYQPYCDQFVTVFRVVVTGSSANVISCANWFIDGYKRAVDQFGPAKFFKERN